VWATEETLFCNVLSNTISNIISIESFVYSRTYKTLDTNISNGASETLPQGWEIAETENGEIYYYNSITGESQWEVPH
jgi:hypothetical protein